MSSFQGMLAVNQQILLGVRYLYQASENVYLDEFKTYVCPILNNHPFIQALEWIPRVSAANRESYERNLREKGFPDFQFTERLINGKMGPASLRPEYYPVYFIDPLERNKNALGFDLASNSTRLKFLRQSRDTGKSLATDKETIEKVII